MADARFCVGFSSACKQVREGGGLPAYEPSLISSRGRAFRPWLPPEIVHLIDAMVRRLEHEDALLRMNGGDLEDTLCEAAAAGGLCDVCFLMSRGAHMQHTTIFVSVNGDERNWSALVWASWFGHLAVCGALLASDVPSLDDSLDVALVNATHNGHTHVVALLLDRGADIHYQSGVPLTNAVIGGHLSTVRLLLDRGAESIPVTESRSRTQPREASCPSSRSSWTGARIFTRRGTLRLLRPLSMDVSRLCASSWIAAQTFTPRMIVPCGQLPTRASSWWSDSSSTAAQISTQRMRTLYVQLGNGDTPPSRRCCWSAEPCSHKPEAPLASHSTHLGLGTRCSRTHFAQRASSRISKRNGDRGGRRALPSPSRRLLSSHG
jgi:hypothetical protein